MHEEQSMQSGRLCTHLQREFPQTRIPQEANHNTKLSIWSQMLAPTHKSSIFHPTLVINKQELFSEYANPASRQAKTMKNAWKNSRNHLLHTTKTFNWMCKPRASSHKISNQSPLQRSRHPLFICFLTSSSFFNKPSWGEDTHMRGGVEFDAQPSASSLETHHSSSYNLWSGLRKWCDALSSS